MANGEHILISLEERHAENILSGQKHVELRRRPMNVKVGTTVWIYVKLPIGSVVGRARVSGFHCLAPSTLWRRFSDVSGVSRGEFFEYFEGVSKGFALSLESAERMLEPAPLELLRSASSDFHPPQFFMRLSSESALLKILDSPNADSTR